MMMWKNDKNKKFFENKERYIGKLFIEKDKHINAGPVLVLNIELGKTEIDSFFVNVTFLEKKEICNFSFLYASWEDVYNEII